MTKALETERNLIHTVNGKTVLLMKATSELHSKVEAISDTLREVDSNFREWKKQLEQTDQNALANFTLFSNFFLVIPRK